LGAGLSVVVAFVAASGLVAESRATSADTWVQAAAVGLSSGLLLGTTLAAMLLGHYYLTAPAMSIEPLKRTVAMVATALAARGLLAGLGLRAALVGGFGAGTSPGDSSLRMLLAARWGMGFVGAGAATYMAMKTARIRSTQSATGILYITMIFVLFGELTAMILAGRLGNLC
jgi:hypothetical protein